jgi:hypothetical protein
VRWTFNGGETNPITTQAAISLPVADVTSGVSYCVVFATTSQLFKLDGYTGLSKWSVAVQSVGRVSPALAPDTVFAADSTGEELDDLTDYASSQDPAEHLARSTDATGPFQNFVSFAFCLDAGEGAMREPARVQLPASTKLLGSAAATSSALDAALSGFESFALVNEDGGLWTYEEPMNTAPINSNNVFEAKLAWALGTA